MYVEIYVKFQLRRFETTKQTIYARLCSFLLGGQRCVCATLFLLCAQAARHINSYFHISYLFSPVSCATKSTHTHTRVSITIPDTTPAKHKVQNSIEKLCAELCSFCSFFATVRPRTMRPAPTVGYIILHLSDPGQSPRGITLGSAIAIVLYGFSMHSQLQSATTRVAPLSRHFFVAPARPRTFCIIYF